VSDKSKNLLDKKKKQPTTEIHLSYRATKNSSTTKEKIRKTKYLNPCPKNWISEKDG
jgi:hypothetical protein